MSRFSVENFLSNIAKKLVRESFSLSLNSEKFMDKTGEGRREYQDTSSKIFCLTVPKMFVGESFGVSLNSIIEIFWG